MGRAFGGLWTATSHLVGGSARRVGHGARDLDPAHRRDGFGLLLIAVALLFAAATWWQLSGPVGDFLRAVVVGGMGVLAWTLPILLAAWAWRVLRHPDRNAPQGRVLIGWLAVLLGTLGLVHVVTGTAQPGDGAAAMRGGGGWIGWLAASPLEALLTGFLAGPLLLLLAGFGVLVLTGTPVHLIGQRLGQARDRLLRRSPEVVDVRDEPAAPEPLQRSRPRRRVGVSAEPTEPQPFDHGVVPTHATSRRPNPPRRAPRSRASRSPRGPSSSRCPATSSTPCRPSTCSRRAPRTSSGPRPTTPSWRRSPACSTSSRSTPR